MNRVFFIIRYIYICIMEKFMPGKKLYRGNEDKVIDQKHFINTKLVEIMEYRQSRKWYVSIAVVGLFSFILALMIYFMAMGKDVTDGWKEILLLMLGGFVGSFAKVIDFWFNNQENDNKLLEHADD